MTSDPKFKGLLNQHSIDFLLPVFHEIKENNARKLFEKNNSCIESVLMFLERRKLLFQENFQKIKLFNMKFAGCDFENEFFTEIKLKEFLFFNGILKNKENSEKKDLMEICKNLVFLPEITKEEHQLCKICCENKIDVVLNCGHVFCCKCTFRANECFLCKKKIKKRIKTFI